MNLNPTLFDPTLEWDSLPQILLMDLAYTIVYGLSNLMKLIQILIYPNPVRMKEKVFISNKHTVDEINIYNQLGKLISTNKYNSNNIIVDISNFTSGIYFVSLKIKPELKQEQLF